MEDKELITNATQLLSELCSSKISSNYVCLAFGIRSICNLKASALSNLRIAS